MFYREKTEEGSIILDRAVMGFLIRNEIEQYGGKLLLATQKGKPADAGEKSPGKPGKSKPVKRPRSAKKQVVRDDGQFMEISLGKKGLDLRVFVIVRFGASIGRVTDAFIEGLKRSLEESLELEVHSIAVVVTGVQAKQISKRNIEVVRS